MAGHASDHATNTNLTYGDSEDIANQTSLFQDLFNSIANPEHPLSSPVPSVSPSSEVIPLASILILSVACYLLLLLLLLSLHSCCARQGLAAECCCLTHTDTACRDTCSDLCATCSQCCSCRCSCSTSYCTDLLQYYVLDECTLCCRDCQGCTAVCEGCRGECWGETSLHVAGR